MKPTVAASSVEEQENTMLGVINKYFASKEFISPAGKLPKGKEPLGEMTDYEKAIYTAHCAAADVCNEIDQKAKATGFVDVPTLAAFKQAEKNFNLLAKLLWRSINSRFPTANGIKEGFKIVEGDKSDCEECPIFGITCRGR